MHRNLSCWHSALREILQNLAPTNLENQGLTKQKTIDTAALETQAKNSKEKEAYLQLEKNPNYRIGVGARANLPSRPSFFVEAIINLSTGNGEVNLQQLENTLTCLNVLKTREYTLSYEDANCISCEKIQPLQNLNKEYRAIKELLEKALPPNTLFCPKQPISALFCPF